jgi:hypothetical protein
MRTTNEFYEWLRGLDDDTLRRIQDHIYWLMWERPDHPDDLPVGYSYQQLLEEQQAAREWLIPTLDYPATYESVWDSINNILMDRSPAPQESPGLQSMVREEPDDEVPF